jgi:hypothetical protein
MRVRRKPVRRRHALAVERGEDESAKVGKLEARDQ